MDALHINGSILEKEVVEATPKEKRVEPKPIEDLIKDAASEIAGIFDQNDLEVAAAPKA